MTSPRTQPETDVAVSGELFAPGAPGVELCYQTFGDPDDDPLLLVMGLGGPMTWWDPALCRMLAERGFYVIRYDNRDTGRSTKVGGRVTRSMLVRAFAGRRVRTPYGIADMAADAVRPARPPRPRVGPRRRRLDGRHDRADDGHRAARGGCGR